MTDQTDAKERQNADDVAAALAGASHADRERLARIVNLLPCYVVLVDKDHRIRFYNKAFEQFFGNAEGQNCHCLLRGQQEPCRFCPPMDVINSRSSSVMEWVHPRTKHAFRVYSYPFEEPGGPKLVLKVGFNITASVRVQQALDLSEQSYRVITDNLSIGIALLDPQLRVKAGNSRLAQWFGQNFIRDRRVCEALRCPGYQPLEAPPPGEAGGHADKAGGPGAAGEAVRGPSARVSGQAAGPRISAVPGNSGGRSGGTGGEQPSRASGQTARERSAQAAGGFASCDDCPFTAAVRDGASHEKEFAVTFQDGAERTVRMVACPVAPRKGGVRALIMMLEDITTRLQVNQQLQRARKIEAMGTLAGGIAHEINQPLSALHLYASGLQMLMEKGEPSRDTLQERLSLIMHEAEKIRSIITHMRALVMREGQVPVGPVSLRQALMNAISIMENQFATRDVTVQFVIPPALPLVRSNAVQLEQVLVNLLGNAVHALASSGSSPGGRIISVIATRKEGGRRVRIEVADSGPGLPKGSERIFDPFYTTKERHQGMGLGLSIVHGLVRSWGGEVSALPRHPLLGGAAFYVELDAAEPAEDDAPSPDDESGT